MRPLMHAAVVPGELWGAWTFEPGVVLPMMAALLLYARGLQRVWSRAGEGRGVRQWQAWCFAGGMAILALALISPLHALGGALFSAHMTQHVLLMGLAAPLLVLGAPLTAFTWALPLGGRRRVGRMLGSGPLHTLWQMLTVPAVAWVLHALAIWVWHVPSLYSATVTSELAHTAQHGSFFLTAVLFWWAVRDRPRHGLAVLYLFTTAVHSSLLGALLAFSPDVLYAPYALTAPVWGMSALVDQQIGGFIMWVPAGLVYFGAALALLASWMRESERRVCRVIPATLVVLVLAGCGGGDGSLESAHAARAAVGDAPASATASESADARVPADVRRGRAAVIAYGCGACHEIRGVAGANGRVGPPLTGVARRVYIAGYLKNEPETMVQWIMMPQAFRQPTAMPNMGVSERDARDITAYLYSLR
jgi:putative membrane protein